MHYQEYLIYSFLTFWVGVWGSPQLLPQIEVNEKQANFLGGLITGVVAAGVTGLAINHFAQKQNNSTTQSPFFGFNRKSNRKFDSNIYFNLKL